MISNCGKDEKGQYQWGQAGDQTGGEYSIVKWFNGPWDCVLRHPDATVRKEISKLAINAATNENIGYDQSERISFWNRLSSAKDYDPASIRIPCEADCSSSTMAIVKAAGYRMKIDSLRNVSPNLTTHTMRAGLIAAGFECLTELKYLESDRYLLVGDILLNDQNHAAINVTNGSAVNGSSSPDNIVEMDSYIDPNWATWVNTNSQKITETTNNVNVGDLVVIAQSASYWTGAKVPKWVLQNKWYVESLRGNRAVLGKSEDGHYNIASPISTNYLTVMNPTEVVVDDPKPKKMYTVLPGDSLWSIARDQLGDPMLYKSIKAWNGIGNLIKPKQVLKLYDPEGE